uniref:hypothetical protein n=2 Tax=Alistipes onderdonkii TaxID=328813 RepID=UPI0040297C1A
MYIFIWPKSDHESYAFCSQFDMSECKFVWVRLKYVKFIRKISNLIQQLYLSIKAVSIAGQGDMIITFNFEQGLYTYFIRRTIRNRGGGILATNMIDHTRKKWKLLIKRQILNMAFKDPSFHITVNNASVLEEYRSRYKRLDPERAYVLHDSYQGNNGTGSYAPTGKYILCAGNIRDWKTFFDVARRLPGYEFVGVGRRHKMTSYLDKIPRNVEMHFDIAPNEVDKLLKESRIVLIPLPSNITNGLTILFQAACNYKPIICTGTPTIRDICALEDGSSGAELVEIGDVADITAKIETLAGDETLGRSLCDKMHIAIQKYSPENYARTLYKHIQHIKQNK